MRHRFILHTALGAALSFLLHAPRAHAFLLEHHTEVTLGALAVRVDPSALSDFEAAALIGDHPDTFYHSAAHYDNCTWSEGQDWILSHRKLAVEAAHAFHLSHASADRQAVLDNLGYVLHTVEDFYAHSNWIETHSWGTLANLEGAKPAGWFSGTYAQSDVLDCPPGTPTHTDLNKDDPSRPGYDEAYADAILGAQAQLASFQAALQAQYPSQASAIFLELGIRPQPARVKDAVAWPNGKIYFFHGPGSFYPTNFYSRYDFWRDSVDGGYPLPVDCGWPGLFHEGPDAGFVMPNQLWAYFFRGSELDFYDVTLDGVPTGWPQPIAGYWPGLWSSGIEAAILWPTDQVYFFKGAQYIKMDAWRGTVDDSYPRSIVPFWKGLEPFSGGVDAAFIAPNGKAYFFKGDYYIRYDVGSDRADGGYPRLIAPNWLGI